MLREATTDDVHLMLSWRNQETNRQVSKTSHEITAEEHARWWSAVRDDPSRRVLTYVRDDSPCGVVTFFDLRLDGPRTGAWGFYLDADGLDARATRCPPGWGHAGGRRVRLRRAAPGPTRR
ncbi:hypothetical protein NKG94_20220 [Micromonospora sp. M12]